MQLCSLRGALHALHAPPRGHTLHARAAAFALVALSSPVDKTRAEPIWWDAPVALPEVSYKSKVTFSGAPRTAHASIRYLAKSY